jgi:two-component system cell cycle sensor histidine kinase/response regulator CckA
MLLELIVGGAVVCGVGAMLRYSCRQAQAAKRLQTITLSSIGDAVIAADDTGAVTFMNPEAERLTGCPAAEAMARPLADVVHVVHEDTGLGAEDPATIVLRTGQQQALSNHTVLINRDGRRTPIETKASPIRYAGGAVEGVVLVFRDCTRIRQIEEADEALHESEERFRQITENISEVFFLTNAPNTELIYVSPAYDAIWGRPSAAVLASAEAWIDAVHPEDRDRIRSALAVKVPLGEFDEEYRIVRPDSTERWIRARAFPVRDANGTIVRHAGVAEDITERRQLEAELRQAQKMESVGLLAGGVAHDFNNALTVIMGSTEVLAEATPSDTEAAAMLDEIRTATDRAASLTRQLLAFSRKDVVAPRIIDFNVLVSQTERMLRRLLEEDIELTVLLDPAIAHVRVDSGQWDQVLMNLAVNARDAMTGCGRLTIRTRDRQVDADSADPVRGIRPGRYVEVSISDTGSGMSEEVMSRIFEPFFTTKGVGHGTGLGLAVVYGIVRHSGGHIDVRSEVNAGTTFTIIIPTVDAAVDGRTASCSSSPAPSETGSETILLVEDEGSLRRMAARLLAKSGYSVVQAASGTEALRVLEQHPGEIDLLVTDVVMPGMDGRELAERVVKLKPATRVLFTSGYTEDAIVHRGVEAARVAFLQKPYAPAALTRKVREVLQFIEPSAA